MSKAPSTEIDPWDRPLDNSGGMGVAQHKVSAPPSAIPDDWDEAESSASEEDNQKIWDNANRKAPMPQLVVTSSATGPTSSSVVVPPASAFQSPIRILKRTVAPTQQCADVDSSTSTMTGTFSERSARYNAARERIFANTTKGGGMGVGEGGAATTIVRHPKGPEHAQDPDGQGSRGFGTRVGKRGNTNQPSEQATDSEGTWGGQDAGRL